MNDENIPPHLAIAKDVTESEFQKAKFQNRIALIATFSVPVLLFLYWLLVNATFLSAEGEPPFKASIVWALIANRGFYYFLKEGRKMSTLRMIKYMELRKLRAFRKENQKPPAGA